MATCKYCHNSNLQWQQTPRGKWALMDGQNYHNCPKRPPFAGPASMSSVVQRIKKARSMVIEQASLDTIDISDV